MANEIPRIYTDPKHCGVGECCRGDGWPHDRHYVLVDVSFEHPDPLGWPGYVEKRRFESVTWAQGEKLIPLWKRVE